MKILEPVRNGMPAPLEARTDGAAIAGGDLLLTGPELSALCSAGISNGLERIRPAVPSAVVITMAGLNGEAGAIQRENVPDPNGGSLSDILLPPLCPCYS
jgi:hypothetical protein